MTMYNPDVRAIAAEFRQECAEDYVGLWQIARSLGSEQIPNAVRTDLIVDVTAHLLADETIRLGQFKEEVFVPWTGAVAAQLERLRTELQQLDRAPDIGEIGWFAAR
jgi:hypothetical protein